jgi:hypothetical protein
MPQKKSYFALRLPKGWWVFGLDQALHGDIDVYQFQFFAELCRNKVCCLLQALFLLDQNYNVILLVNLAPLCHLYASMR